VRRAVEGRADLGGRIGQGDVDDEVAGGVDPHPRDAPCRLHDHALVRRPARELGGRGELGMQPEDERRGGVGVGVREAADGRDRARPEDRALRHRR
jgi:hypothetical protein